MKTFIRLALACWCTAAWCSEFPRVDADIKAYDDRVAQLERDFAKSPAAPDDKTWVKAKLKHMVEVDQYMRLYPESVRARAYSPEEQLAFNEEFVSKRWPAVDLKNTADLKQLLKIYPWFTISAFDVNADNNAWLLVQHADQDRPFQQQVLAILEPLAARGETDPKHYAYLFDRLASSFSNPAERKPQRYGTQGQCTGPGKWEPFPVEDPANLDQRRASVGLPSEAEYQKVFVNICHESTEEIIRKQMEAIRAKDGNATFISPATPH